MADFLSGFVSIVGRPNVGKSTLLNRLVGQKVSIVSNRPQTTRNVIRGVLAREGYQIIFIDTPGMHQPRTELGQYMVKAANQSLADVEAILWVVDAQQGITTQDLHIAAKLETVDAPVIVAVNKIDVGKQEGTAKTLAALSGLKGLRELVPVSAKTGMGTDELEQLLLGFMPPGPRYFPDDMVTDQPERFIIAEFIREKALRLLHQEVPHGIGVEIMRIQKLDNGVVEVMADIYCDKASHKGIIIGKNGSMLQEIGSLARAEIERMLEEKVFLKLYVRVREDWRNRPGEMHTLGYE